MSEHDLEVGKLERDEQALQDLLEFPLVEALFGRRSRRFFRGAEIPDGPLAYRSRHEPLPLTVSVWVYEKPAGPVSVKIMLPVGK